VRVSIVQSKVSDWSEGMVRAVSCKKREISTEQKAVNRVK
jgi:hypothetical protein